ncbi:long-chain fatty acid--CoA ligase [Brucepastera parasyntrophica]|uniref:AMP-dependent synthetase/ligase n=1 Tax=Brucepastera parasyntrophica TaxID=2880008 RepID=UPI00210DF765|nr:long-chain fatty acid--CoA ligase [Brucepastera parasyntrophica]ULQ60640.1 long-chain fatty acid--CoA ligase [Brucepastera parasyntrophica]
MKNTIPLLFKDRAMAYPEITVQAYKDKEGTFQYRTYWALYGDVLDFAAGLRSMDVARGEYIGLISDNRREWLITDLAVMTLGCADVPRGSDTIEKELVFILSSTECKIACIENKHQLKKLLNSVTSLPKLKTLILFEDAEPEDIELAGKQNLQLQSFSSVLAAGKTLRLDADSGSKNGELYSTKALESEMEKGLPTDLATIIFTSGTTGEPKGVMLTQSNYIWQLERTPKVLYGVPGDMWLSVLPVWHSFERLMQYIILERASGMAYSRPIASIMLPDIAVISPQIIPGVPRLWEAVAAGVFRSMKKEGGIKKTLFTFFIFIGKKFRKMKENLCGQIVRFTRGNRFLQILSSIIPFLLLAPLYGLGDLLVYRKIRAKFGKGFRTGISGGGALQPDIDDFYRAIGLNLLEGYGVTETAPLLSLRNERKPTTGCVGKMLPDTECRIVDPDTLAALIEKEHETGSSGNSDSVRGSWAAPEPLPTGKTGVIMVRGGQVMKGYFKRPDLTRCAVSSDGWYNTGDIGVLSIDGDLKITGRAKDTIVLLGGENIEPVPIEQAIKNFQLVENVIVLGQDKKFLAALIVPVKDMVLAYAAEQDIFVDDYANLLKNPEIIQLFRTAIDSRINRQNGFRPFEFIYRFALLPDSFRVGEELSMKQEMMRHKINEIYKDEIEDIFSDEC